MPSDFKKFSAKFFLEMRRYMDYTEASDIKKVHQEIFKKIPLGLAQEGDTIFNEGDTFYEECSIGLYEVAIATAQGAREEMEDQHLATEFHINKILFDIGKIQLFAVFDGHGGKVCAKYVKEYLPELLKEELNQCKQASDLEIYNALRRTFIKIDKNWKDLPFQKTLHRDISGTTATTSIIIGNHLWVANVGDSRTVLVKNGQAIQLSEEAKASIKKYEREIYLRGGHTRHGRVVNNTGSLDMARSIGDIEQSSVSALPTIRKFDLEALKGKEFQIVLGCDGLWDVVNPQIAAKICCDNTSITEMAHALKDLAFANGTADNVTVMIIRRKN